MSSSVMASMHRDSQRDIDDRHSTCKTSSTSYLKVPPIVSSRETNRQRMAWVEEKNKAAAIAAAAIGSTVSDAARRTTPEFTKGGRLIPYEWRSPSPHELGKRVIRGSPHTYNNNGSWNGSWKLDTNSDSSLTPEDAAAAATAIAMFITG